MPSHLWLCPTCGRRFRHSQTNHSCGKYALDDHFIGKDPLVRDLFDRLLAEIEQFGPVSVHPVKTRIIFQAQVQFAATITHKTWLEGLLWLRRQATHPRIHHIEMGVFRDYGHVFRLDRLRDLDEELIELLHEAYVLGEMVS